jgi:hypothetical protein
MLLPAPHSALEQSQVHIKALGILGFRQKICVKRLDSRFQNNQFRINGATDESTQ